MFVIRNTFDIVSIRGHILRKVAKTFETFKETKLEENEKEYKPGV